MRLPQLVSPFLTNYLRDHFGDLDLTETKADCKNCICARQKGNELPQYKADIKCCTFHPFIPNYAVGAILDQNILGTQNNTPRPKIDPRTLQIIHNKIAKKEYALPLGIFAPVRYQYHFHRRKPEDFGNNEGMICPYLLRESAQCGLWIHRSSVCMSYYCASDYGKNGLLFWELFGDYVHHLEMALAQDCMVSMGFSPDVIDLQLEYMSCETGTPEELATDSLADSVHASYWKDWGDNDSIDYYQSCAKYAKSLQNKDLEEMIDNEGRRMEQDLKSVIATLNLKT